VRASGRRVFAEVVKPLFAPFVEFLLGIRCALLFRFLTRPPLLFRFLTRPLFFPPRPLLSFFFVPLSVEFSVVKFGQAAIQGAAFFRGLDFSRFGRFASFNSQTHARWCRAAFAARSLRDGGPRIRLRTRRS
jgi:hypothetical protein